MILFCLNLTIIVCNKKCVQTCGFFDIEILSYDKMS